jgi:hypothetical protein
MVAYCNRCQRYVNQSCEKCGATYGIDICEWYACGGRMICPSCGGSDLVAKKGFDPDPYDFSKQKDLGPARKGKPTPLEAKYYAEQKVKEETRKEQGQAPVKAESTCRLCGFTLSGTWKFCPECGTPLTKR